MAVVVRANLENVIQYKGKNVMTKIGSKKHQVLFRVEADDFSLLEAIEQARVDKNILMIEFAGSDNFIRNCQIDTSRKVPYVGVYFEVGLNLTESDIQTALSEYPDWVTLIIKLPDDYKDIQFLYEMCQKYERIRFCGGYTFNIDGCRLGCCGKDILDELNIKLGTLDYIHQGCSCALPIINFEDADLVVSQKSECKSNTTKAKPSSVRKPKAVFSDLLHRGTIDF